MIKNITEINPYENKEEFIKEALIASLELPLEIRKNLEFFKRFGNDDGYMLIKNMPIDYKLINTPKNNSDVFYNKNTFASEFSLSVVGGYLGSLYAYKQESNGSLFNNIRPTLQSKSLQSSESSDTFLELHTEIAFHDVIPDFILLYCLREDRNKAAKTGVSCIRNAIKNLDDNTLDILRTKLFKTSADYSFISDEANKATKNYYKELAILSGVKQDPLMVYDSDLMIPNNDEAKQAMMLLDISLRESMKYITLEQGDIVIIDNRRCVHSRTKFKAYFDGHDRWLQRSFVKVSTYAAEKLYSKRLDIIDTIF